MPERRFFVRGEIDLANAPVLHAEIHEVLKRNEDDLAVDCCGLTFIDSTGIAVLLATAEMVQARGRAFRVVNADQLTARLIGQLGMSEVLSTSDAKQS